MKHEISHGCAIGPIGPTAVTNRTSPTVMQQHVRYCDHLARRHLHNLEGIIPATLACSGCSCVLVPVGHPLFEPGAFCHSELRVEP